MHSDSFAIPSRRVRRISFALAAMLHTAALAVLMNYLLGHLHHIPTDVETIARSELVNEEIVERLTAELAKQPQPSERASPSMATAVEPGAGVIDSVIEKIRNYQDSETGPDPLATLRRNAALLEQISSPKEVDRMAAKLREAMGANSMASAGPTADTPPVHWPDAIPSGGKRVEDGDRVEIHETFIDAAGGASTMIHAREPLPDSDEFHYTIAILERGKREPASRTSKDEFDLAAARVRPFEIIDQFPLLQELHRSAVVPIMQKMTQNEDQAAATTQPAAPADASSPTSRPQS